MLLVIKIFMLYWRENAKNGGAIAGLYCTCAFGYSLLLIQWNEWNLFPLMIDPQWTNISSFDDTGHRHERELQWKDINEWVKSVASRRRLPQKTVHPTLSSSFLKNFTWILNKIRVLTFALIIGDFTNICSFSLFFQYYILIQFSFIFPIMALQLARKTWK